MKVLFDTNVYIAERIAGGAAAFIVESTRSLRWRIFTSDAQLDELRRVLGEKLGIPTKDTENTVRRVIFRSQIVEAPPSRHQVQSDRDDDTILRAALAAGVDYLVTNDEHLLDLHPYEGVRIVSMNEYLRILRGYGKAWRPRGSRAFTLIELLVVVSIIALLIALLLPSLGSARERARQASCMSQMKQISFATEAYLSDHTEYWPGWFNTLTPITTLRTWRGAELPAEALLCPSGEMRPNPKGRSYSVNAYLLYQNWPKRSKVPRPAQTLWMVEEHEISIDNEHFAVRTGEWWNVISARHPRGANMTFTDGSAAFWPWRDANTGIWIAYFLPDPGNVDLDRINRAQCPPTVP